jgi:hypothetical protein
MDYKSLQYLTNIKTYLKRLARWIEEFQTYNLVIQYCKGTEAVVPNIISY